MLLRRASPRVLPGFGLAMGYTVFYLSLIVLLPLSALFSRAAGLGWSEFWATVTHRSVLPSFRLTFGAAFAAATINAVFGFIVAWTLVRYRFPGKRLIDAMVDLPFALPTAVSGIALTALYVPEGWIGRWLAPLGVKVAFTPLGVIVAMTFIGVPFVVRTLQPALADLDRETEEAAASLGANRLQTFFRVIVPTVLPALLTGFALALARAIGEYGSVIFIAGKTLGSTQITPLLIMTRLDEHDPAGAAAIAVAMLIASFLILLFINAIQWWTGRRYRGAT